MDRKKREIKILIGEDLNNLPEEVRKVLQEIIKESEEYVKGEGREVLESIYQHLEEIFKEMEKMPLFCRINTADTIIISLLAAVSTNGVEAVGHLERLKYLILNKPEIYRKFVKATPKLGLPAILPVPVPFPIPSEITENN